MSTTAVDTIVPTQTALLLMDFQPLILSQIADRDALLDNARAALHWAREHGVRVVFVRVAFAPEDYDAIPHHHKAFAAAKQQHLFADGDPALDITPELEVRPDDLVVRKTRYGAFSTTGLHAVLGDAAIDTLIVGGISTAGVVLSTVRDAADQDYRLFVLADATADTDPEVHRVLIDKVLPRQADMITTSTLPTVTPAA